MTPIDNSVLYSQLKWRYACKKFDPNKKIREADFNLLLESLRLSASSYGLQPWKFLVIQDPGLRRRLYEASYNQTPVFEASHLIVIAYKENLDIEHIERHILQTSKVRELNPTNLEKFKSVIVQDLIEGSRSKIIQCWAQRQCYLALGSLLTTAAMMQIDSLPMEGIKPEEYDKILELEGTGYKTLVAVPCGYRSSDDQYQHAKKVRFDQKDVIIYK
jgi:nitroreductase